MKKTKNSKYEKMRKKQLKKDRKRIFRVVEHLHFTALIDRSPVQILEGYVVADVETHEIFAAFTFQNLSDKTLKSLDITLCLFDGGNVPYVKIPYTYSMAKSTFGRREKPGEVKRNSWEKLFSRKKPFFAAGPFLKEKPGEDIAVRETFGKASYIRLPETYFKKISLEITGTVYGDGTSESHGIVVPNRCTRFSELNDEKKYAFSRVNIYREAEMYHPTRVIPQKTESAWLCCCGHKNLGADEECAVCRRDRDWQLKNIAEERLEKKVDELKRESDLLLRNKAKFKPYQKEESDAEIQQKIKDYEKVIRQLAEQELKNEYKKKMILPKIVLFFALIYLLIYLLQTLT